MNTIHDDRIEAFNAAMDAERAPVDRTMSALYDAAPRRVFDEIERDGKTDELMVRLETKLGRRPLDSFAYGDLVAIAREAIDELRGITPPPRQATAFPKPLSMEEVAERAATEQLTTVRGIMQRWETGELAATAALDALRRHMEEVPVDDGNIG